MASSDLDSLYFHINTKISTVKKALQLRRIGEEPSLKSMLCKIGKEVVASHGLLDKMEMEVQRQEKLRDMLKALQKSAEENLLQAQHLCESIPQLLKPFKICVAIPLVKKKEQRKAIEPEHPKKPSREKIITKKVSLITVEEFKDVPAYMKGRITCEQINSSVNEINKALETKYKILQQSLKSMNTATRKHYHRFKEEETKDTKGEFFFVEADIREFTHQKTDRRFYVILNILRHCQRLREVRGSNLVRYVIC
ncbi:spindle and kinetochore-associated protein 1 [Indicator indicator]|uniref:spindle and kinetochore-associated protein 1 n=1 Tax=Indicator indicator TaxID=1002788 RepID=UPI0023DE7FA2|nr:spindle and kinetochore-associated protein 1 [Indicator indicator]